MKQWVSNHIFLTILVVALLTAAISIVAAVTISKQITSGIPGLQGEQGLPGTNGTDGKSAYEIAVENGFVGTEEEWLASLMGGVSEASDKGYVIVTNYVPANTGADVSDELQKIINENPNKTIFFPDGEYIIAKPIATSANPVNAVSFQLSNFAVIKAADTWDSKEAMIRLGAAEPFNNITTNGSNYSFVGGIIDGNGIANGIAIESGRETSIHNVSIKHTMVGIHIKHGANSGSSDADIDAVNIVGNQDRKSIGVWIQGHDNTLSNMRIAYVKTGVLLQSNANYLTNIHPLGLGSLYAGSVAFRDEGGSNRFFRCYSDQFETGFRVGSCSVYDTCFCYWWNDDVSKQTGFMSPKLFDSVIINADVSFRSESVKNRFFVDSGNGIGNGVIIYPRFNQELNSDDSYQNYLEGKVLP